MSTLDFGVSAVSLKTFTVKEVYDALAANGFEHLRGKWIDVDSQGKPVGGCVLGQTAVNLGVFAESEQFSDALYDVYITQRIPDDDDEEDYRSVDDRVDADMETYSHNTLEVQLNRFLVPDDSPWNYGAGEAGSVIIHWNDQPSDDGKGYALATYEAVTEMAYDILSPLFDETVTIAVQEYDLSARKVNA